MAAIQAATTAGHTILKEEVIDAFQARLRGELLRPRDDHYDAARKIWNMMIDKRPALIARCVGAADVIQCVNLAREHDLLVSVRGGGHNIAGHAVCDGGLMIDLSGMKAVRVDPVRRTAQAQPGLRWGEFDRETQAFGLATTGGIFTPTGIAGLTLGGGLGWLMSKHGLTCDNLLSADVVTADGQLLAVNGNENPELFWGLRGGGGNFGIVTSFEYRLHPVGPVVSGLVAHPIDNAREVLRFYREFTASLPDELTAYALLAYAPDGSGTPIAAIAVCHCGPLTEAEAAVRPVKEFGSPLMDVIGPTGYEETNMMFDAGYPKGALNYWKSSFLSELSDGAIDTLADQFSTCPSPMSSLGLEHIHGAATRVGATETAFPHRQPGYNFLALSEWLDPAQSEQNVAWARESYAAMQPHMASGRYVNYIGEEEGEDPVRAAYGPNYERLAQLKNKYDPSNLFHMNQNIAPAV